MMRYSQFPGQSFAEYSLGIALVLLAAVGGLMALSGSINSGFLSILGSGSAQNPNGMPFHATVTATASAGAPSTANVSAAGTSSLASSNIQTGQQATAVQTVGSNGGSATVQANSQKLMDIAAKYQDSDPALANLIEQLAQKGFSLADAMQNTVGYDGTNVDTAISTRNTLAKGALVDFQSMWTLVKSSAEYDNLSTKDQKLVASLAGDNSDRGQTVLSSLNNSGSASAQVVNNNSQTIHTCSDSVCGNSGP